MKTLHLFPQPRVESGASIKRVCRIKRFDGLVEISDDELWFEIDRIDELPADDDCESYLLSMLMEGMAENREIVVHGAVSKEMLSNLTEFRDVWVCWRPRKYSRIKIKIDRLTHGRVRKSGAICAFSGGVDACFSVWRNTGNRNGARTQDLRLAAMVHGFDIPIEDKDAFAKAFSRARETLNSLGIPLRPIRTNFRTLSRLNWEDVFGPALVAALGNYKGLAGVCLIASGEPYNALVLPWGSTPFTDPMLGSADFFVIHDGASHNRTEKVLAIAEWRAGFENLRVCWQREAKDNNCGKCEKCVRTSLNIAANKLPIPPCFPNTAINLEILRGIELKNDVQREEWRQLLETARGNGIVADWVVEVDKKINPDWLKLASKKVNLQPLKDFIFPEKSIRKRFAKKIYLYSKRLG